jgi:hypothetical protein
MFDYTQWGYMRQKEDLKEAAIRIERMSINVWVFQIKLIKYVVNNYGRI